MLNSMKRLACCLAVVGLVVPQQIFAAAPIAKTSDVRIAGGVLAGRVVTEAGQPAVTTVAVFQNKTEVARTQTDTNGVYRIQNLRSGAYTVATPASATNVRVWEGAAPAKATSSLTLTEGSIVRGQYCDSGCDGGCDGCGSGCGMMGGNGGKILGIALVAGAVTAVAIAVSDDDDSSPATP